MFNLIFMVQGFTDAAINEIFKRNHTEYGEDTLAELLKEIKPNINDEHAGLLAGVMVSMMEGASVQILSDKESFDLEKYFDICFTMINDI